MSFIPNTDEDRKQMLAEIGIESFEDLLKNIPDDLRLKAKLNLPEPLSELEIRHELQALSEKNKSATDAICFLGGGAYDHFIPAAVGHITSRSEFYTAYTPYQAEVSQGTLQTIYEFQTLICELAGMEVANASMYDGGSALAEAALMAVNETKRTEVLLSKAVHPYYRQIIKTYFHGQRLEVKEIPIEEGITSIDELKRLITDKTAGVIIQHPNFFGFLENVFGAESIIHEKGALYITSNDPISLGILAPPGEYGVDIMTGEGQALGNALNFGGPYLGLLAIKRKYIRKMPGRLVGATEDTQARRGFVLAMQTREQHIRREKATSNICTNQALCALAATVYLTLMGKQGIKKVAELCLQKSHYLADKISSLKGFDLAFKQPFFKEFAIKCPLSPKELIKKLEKKKILAGIDLSQFDHGIPDGLLIAVTEKRFRKELDYFIESLSELVN